MPISRYLSDPRAAYFRIARDSAGSANHEERQPGEGFFCIAISRSSSVAIPRPAFRHSPSSLLHGQMSVYGSGNRIWRLPVREMADAVEKHALVPSCEIRLKPF